MKRYQSIGDLPLGEERRVVAIGTFDGVHIGQQDIPYAEARRAIKDYADKTEDDREFSARRLLLEWQILVEIHQLQQFA